MNTESTIQIAKKILLSGRNQKEYLFDNFHKINQVLTKTADDYVEVNQPSSAEMIIKIKSRLAELINSEKGASISQYIREPHIRSNSEIKGNIRILLDNELDYIENDLRENFNYDVADEVEFAKDEIDAAYEDISGELLASYLGSLIGISAQPKKEEIPEEKPPEEIAEPEIIEPEKVEEETKPPEEAVAEPYKHRIEKKSNPENDTIEYNDVFVAPGEIYIDESGNKQAIEIVDTELLNDTIGFFDESSDIFDIFNKFQDSREKFNERYKISEKDPRDAHEVIFTKLKYLIGDEEDPEKIREILKLDQSKMESHRDTLKSLETLKFYDDISGNIASYYHRYKIGSLMNKDAYEESMSVAKELYGDDFLDDKGKPNNLGDYLKQPENSEKLNAIVSKCGLDPSDQESVQKILDLLTDAFSIRSVRDLHHIEERAQAHQMQIELTNVRENYRNTPYFCLTCGRFRYEKELETKHRWSEDGKRALETGKFAIKDAFEQDVYDIDENEKKMLSEFSLNKIGAQCDGTNCNIVSNFFYKEDIQLPDASKVFGMTQPLERNGNILSITIPDVGRVPITCHESYIRRFAEIRKNIEGHIERGNTITDIAGNPFDIGSINDSMFDFVTQIARKNYFSFYGYGKEKEKEKRKTKQQLDEDKKSTDIIVDTGLNLFNAFYQSAKLDNDFQSKVENVRESMMRGNFEIPPDLEDNIAKVIASSKINKMVMGVPNKTYMTYFSHPKKDKKKSEMDNSAHELDAVWKDAGFFFYPPVAYPEITVGRESIDNKRGYIRDYIIKIVIQDIRQQEIEDLSYDELKEKVILQLNAESVSYPGNKKSGIFLLNTCNPDDVAEQVDYVLGLINKYPAPQRLLTEKEMQDHKKLQHYPMLERFAKKVDSKEIDESGYVNSEEIFGDMLQEINPTLRTQLSGDNYDPIYIKMLLQKDLRLFSSLNSRIKLSDVVERKNPKLKKGEEKKKGRTVRGFEKKIPNNFLDQINDADYEQFAERFEHMSAIPRQQDVGGIGYDPAEIIEKEREPQKTYPAAVQEFVQLLNTPEPIQNLLMAQGFSGEKIFSSIPAKQVLNLLILDWWTNPDNGKPYANLSDLCYNSAMAMWGRLPSREDMATSWGSSLKGEPGLLNGIFGSIFNQFQFNFCGEDMKNALGVVQGVEKFKGTESKSNSAWYKVAQQNNVGEYPAAVITSDFDIVSLLNSSLINSSGNDAGMEKNLPILEVVPFKNFGSLSGIQEFNQTNNGFKATAINADEYKSLVEMGLIT